MNGLSDLELVAQAMAPTRQPPNANQSTTSPPEARDSHPSESPVDNTNGPTTTITRPLDPLASIDLSALSPSELSLLQPLLDALNSSARSPDGEDGIGDAEIEALMAQMDVAGEVADEIEGKLDRLLENLGKVEEEIGKDLPNAVDREKDGDEELGGGGEEKKE